MKQKTPKIPLYFPYPLSSLLYFRVTKLVIRRPLNFKYSPGDWVFVRIPDIAAFEWHPFTISSAPEVSDVFTLHIRGVGEWTNRLFGHYESLGKAHAKESIKMSRRYVRVQYVPISCIGFSQPQS